MRLQSPRNFIQIIFLFTLFLGLSSAHADRIPDEPDEPSCEDYSPFPPPNCTNTTVHCSTEGLPPGAGGRADNSNAPNCEVWLEQVSCTACGISDGDVLNNADGLCPKPYKGEGDEEITSRYYQCKVAHESEHLDQKPLCPDCLREKESYQAELNCYQQIHDDLCSGSQISDLCGAIDNAIQLAKDRIAFMGCLCNSNEGSLGEDSYPSGTCDTCAELIGDPDESESASDMYCRHHEQGDQNGITASSTGNFSPSRKLMTTKALFQKGPTSILSEKFPLVFSK